MTDHDRHLFRGFDRPALPENLHQQVLWRSRAALRSPIPRADLWGRIRENRGWRLAWVVSVAALCTANLVLGGWMTPPPKPALPSVRIAPDPEIRAIADLPRLRMATGELQGGRGEPQTTRPDTEDLS